MKKLLRTLPLLTLVLTGCSLTTVTKTTTRAITPSATSAPQKTIYSNASGLTMTYTNDWKYLEGIYGSLVTFFSPQGSGDLFRENLGVSVEKLPSSLTIQQYYDTTKTQLGKLIKDFKELSTEDVVVAGLPAKKIVYEGSQQSYKLKWEQVFLIKDKNVYLFTYTATAESFPSYLAQVDEMIKSVKLP